MKPDLADKFYDLISDDEDARVCKDISDEACKVVPGNFLKQVCALVATKTGDALSKPGLILTWLLTAIGAPAATIAILAPIREAGSLLPQMIVGGVIRRFPIRKGFWVVGAILQGLSVLLMAIAALTLGGVAAGWAIVGLLVIFSLSRGICSIASNDLLGKTIPKTRRGRLSGIAASISGYTAVLIGLYFAFNNREDVPVTMLATLLVIAAVLWFAAAAIMASLDEKAGATSGGANALKEAFHSLHLLRDNRTFRNFCIARALLASTVLSMPFYVVIAHTTTGGRLASLGILIVSGSAATALSAVIWGKLADQSSRLTLAISGTAAGLTGCLTAGLAGLNFSTGASLWIYGFLFFLIGLAHTGIRLGRKTYLVDMATEENRSIYVAVSNTLIGIVLLSSGAVGLLADVLGARGVILVFAILGLIGGLFTFALPEVQEE